MSSPKAESMLRYARKIGKIAFFQWLHKNHQFDYLMKQVKILDKESSSPIFTTTYKAAA